MLIILPAALLLFGCEITHRDAAPGAIDAAESAEVTSDASSDAEDEPVVLDPDDDRSLEQRLQDASLAAQVKLALADEKELRRLDFEPEVREGVVLLQGAVPSKREYSLAADVVRRVPGVRAVQNRLEAPDVEPAPLVPQDTLTKGASSETTKRDALASGASESTTAAPNAPSRPETPPGQAEAEPSSAYHTVASGESLWEIARKNGTTVAALKRLNNLSGDRVRPGQRLQVK